MSLTAAAIQAAKPREEPYQLYQLFDQGGLFCSCIPIAGGIGASNTECMGARSY
jgi:hypothetical protein